MNDDELALATDDEAFVFTSADLKLIETALAEKIEALSACFGVMPLGSHTRSLMQHRNDLLPLHDKIKRLRREIAPDTP